MDVKEEESVYGLRGSNFISGSVETTAVPSSLHPRAFPGLSHPPHPLKPTLFSAPVPSKSGTIQPQPNSAKTLYSPWYVFDPNSKKPTRHISPAFSHSCKLTTKKVSIKTKWFGVRKSTATAPRALSPTRSNRSNGSNCSNCSIVRSFTWIRGLGDIGVVSMVWLWCG